MLFKNVDDIVGEIVIQIVLAQVGQRHALREEPIAEIFDGLPVALLRGRQHCAHQK